MYYHNNEIALTLVAAETVLNARFAGSDLDAIPVSDDGFQADVFLAYEDGTLAEVPYALDAWLDQQQHETVQR